MSIFRYVARAAVERPASLSLSEKYEPRSADQIFGRQDEVGQLRAWLTAFQAAAGGAVPRFALLSGPSGTGKSVTARTVLADLGMHCVDVNPSVNRSKKELQEVLALCRGAAAAVLLDEFDFLDLSLSDVRVLLDASPRIPFIIIVNKHSHGKSFDLSKEGLVIHFRPLPPEDVTRWATRVMRAEGMDSKYAKDVVAACDGDMRFILRWLELHHKTPLSAAAFQGGSAGPSGPGAYSKDDDIDCIRATRMLLYSGDALSVEEALRVVSSDVNLISSMVSENFASVADDASPDTLARCADVISCADVLESFVYSHQAWDMWDACALCGAVFPAMLVRRRCATEPNFTKMWSKISNMYYRIYQLNDVRQCLVNNRLSCDLDTLIYMGSLCHHQVVHGDMTACIEALVRMGMSSDNINMLIKQGTMVRYKNTLQKKVKKEYDKVTGKVARRAASRSTKAKPAAAAGDAP
jgi:Replication factor RFC1 C terminal domain/ATPase family associated with various cellular activities (AAA)